jgi:hypothetical protein
MDDLREQTCYAWRSTSICVVVLQRAVTAFGSVVLNHLNCIEAFALAERKSFDTKCRRSILLPQANELFAATR